MVAFIKSLTIWHAAIVAAVAVALALFVVQRGLINTALWIVGLGALLVGAVNKLSYGS